MKLTNEIAILREVLQLSDSDLCSQLGVSMETLNNWKFGRKGVGIASLEKVYSFAFAQGIGLNSIYEQLLREEHENTQSAVFSMAPKGPLPCRLIPPIRRQITISASVSI